MPRLLILLLLPTLALAQPALNVGSKRFTESYILAEILVSTADRAGETRGLHRPGLGNTAILFAALKSGAIEAYPEYTGTIALELLKLDRVPGLEELNRNLARHGLAAGVPLGFSNNYALAMREPRASALGIASISDLRKHRGLRLALSQEFMNRRDGWASLRQAYGLPFADAQGLDHGLAYEALSRDQADVIDVYSTDPKIARYGLRVLKDDRAHFPAYEAVILYRVDLPARFPRTWSAWEGLAGRISPARMIEMNAAAELSGKSFAQVAGDFLSGQHGASAALRSAPARPFLAILFGEDFFRLSLQHLVLVLGSLVLGIALGVPLGVWAHRSPSAATWVLGVCGVLQTVPSIALLAFLIAALDRIGTMPALIALFLYALLPIVRNTQAGLAGVPDTLRDSARSLGLPAGARLRLIELPLAAPTLLAGIKTAAVINVGTATIAAFIGAGGYGERIVAGLAVNNHAMLLAGAVPAAAMALLVQWGFDGLERGLVSPGLRARGRASRG